jgi:hypothetical protein
MGVEGEPKRIYEEPEPLEIPAEEPEPAVPVPVDPDRVPA